MASSATSSGALAVAAKRGSDASGDRRGPMKYTAWPGERESPLREHRERVGAAAARRPGDDERARGWDGCRLEGVFGEPDDDLRAVADGQLLEMHDGRQ